MDTSDILNDILIEVLNGDNDAAMDAGGDAGVENHIEKQGKLDAVVENCDKLIESFEASRTSQVILEVDTENRLDESDLRSEFVLDPAHNPKLEKFTPKVDAEKRLNGNGKRASQSADVDGDSSLVPDPSPKKKRIKLNLNFKKKGSPIKKRGPLNSSIQKAKNTSRKGGNGKGKNGKTFEVEKINNRRIYDGELLYQVKWKNFKGMTWEPHENLMCSELIDEFESKMVDCQKRKQELLLNSTVVPAASAKKNSVNNLRAVSESSTERQAKKLANSKLEVDKSAGRISRRNYAKETNSPAFVSSNAPSSSTAVRNTATAKRVGRPPAASEGTRQPILRLVEKVVSSDAGTPSATSSLSTVENKVVLAKTPSLDGTANSLPSIQNLSANAAGGAVALKILGVRRGSFPGQGPIAHIHNELTNVDEYVPITTLHTQCPQLLCVYYEEYLNLRP